MAIDRNISRRGLFAGSAAALLGASLGLGKCVAGAANESKSAALVSAARVNGIDGGALLSRQTVTPFALPARAHALARFLDHVLAHDDAWVARRIDIARHWLELHPHD